MARICNTSNLRATHWGRRIFSVQADETLENGMLGLVGNLKDGQEEVREFKKVTDITEAGSFVLIADPEVIYSDRKGEQGFKNYKIEAGETARAYELGVNDEFEVSLDGITALSGTPVVGNHVILTNNSLKFTEIATPAGNETFVCSIEGIRSTQLPIQVNKNIIMPTDTKMARLRVVKCVTQKA